MIRRTRTTVSLVFGLFLSLVTLSFIIGCGGGLDKIAQDILYPHDSVNKRFEVPALPHEGLEQIFFRHVDEDGESYRTHAWYHVQNNNSAPVLVYFHGNGENLESLYQSNFLGTFKNLGFHFVAIDYPKYGLSTGTPSEPTILEGANAAINWANQKFPNSKIVVWGFSLGAAVAMKSASLNEDIVDRLILTSPWNNFLDLAISKTRLIRQVSEEWISKNRWDSSEAASSYVKPALIHHGGKDSVIPLKFGQLLFDSFPSEANVSFNILAERGHNDLFQDSRFWDDIVNFTEVDRARLEEKSPRFENINIPQQSL